MTVWVIEQGEYEERGVVDVAASLEAALTWLKEIEPSLVWPAPPVEHRYEADTWYTVDARAPHGATLEFSITPYEVRGVVA